MITGYRVDGLAETTKALQDVSKAMRGAVVRQSVRGAATTLQAAVKRGAPKRKGKRGKRRKRGTLQRSIRTTRAVGARARSQGAAGRRTAQKRLSIQVVSGKVVDVIHPGPKAFYALFLEKGTGPRRRRLRNKGTVDQTVTGTRRLPGGADVDSWTQEPILKAAQQGH